MNHVLMGVAKNIRNVVVDNIGLFERFGYLTILWRVYGKGRFKKRKKYMFILR